MNTWQDNLHKKHNMKVSNITELKREQILQACQTAALSVEDHSRPTYHFAAAILPMVRPLPPGGCAEVVPLLLVRGSWHGRLMALPSEALNLLLDIQNGGAEHCWGKISRYQN